jgi:exodeoxyribonuclease-5
VTVELSPAQREASSRILDWLTRSPERELYLAGYAGTGKTTIAAQLIAELELRVCVATLTGKAASVLRRKGVYQAQTIHSMIYVPVPNTDPIEWSLDQVSPLAYADLLIVDEVSMVGHDLADDLRSYGKKILVLGDPGQLPPIHGTGAFTSREPDVFLSEIHRQAAESPIIRLATMARQGQPIPLSDEPVARVVPLSFNEVLASRGQLICGTHRARWAITKRVRERDGFGGTIPGAGERVICRRNNREHGLYNGLIGTVAEVLDDGDNDEEGRPYLKIVMDDLQAPIETRVELTPFLEHTDGLRRPYLRRRGVELFDFGYVLTCHSAQGSEWPDVTVVDDSSAFREDADRWLYTALTRASERITLLKRIP